MSIYAPQNRYSYPEACYALNLNRYEMKMHQHHRCEIMYVADGSCQVFLEKEQITLHSKQLIFLDADVWHQLWIPPNTSCTLFNLEFVCQEQAQGIDLYELAQKEPAFTRFLEKRAPYLVLFDPGKLGYALKDLIGELSDQREQSPYLLSLLFSRVFVELARCTPANVRESGIRYLNKAKRYIEDNLCEELSVPQIAGVVGINHSYLHTLFSKNIGCGVMAYVNRRRLERASFLLKNSSMSITDIAFHVGFNSRQHFGYMFEKQFGMSPKQYRKLNEENLTVHSHTGQLRLDRGRKFIPL